MIPNVENPSGKKAKGSNSRYCFDGNAIILLKPIHESELKTIWRRFSIHHWSNRTSLGIYIFSSISDIQVESICKIIAKCRGLQKVNIYADKCANLTNHSLKKLGYLLSQHLRDLTSLSLQFIVLKQISDQGLRYLASQICTYSTNLRHLKLGFNCFAEISDKGIDWLGSRLKHLKNLESLSLTFWKLLKITNTGCKSLATQIAKDMANLRQLSLDFTGCEEIDDRGLNMLFGTELPYAIANLKHLSIAFGNCLKITDKGLDLIISDILTNFAQLNSLEISFRGLRKITERGIDNAGSKIARSLPKLSSLKLDFQKCDFANSSSLENIALAIVNHLGDLQQLELNFAE